MWYIVTGTIQSRDTSNPPYGVTWYTGDNLALAATALMQAATHNARSDANDEETKNPLPFRMQYRTLSVDMSFTECVWEENQYQPWARVKCWGPVEQTTRQGMTGLLCAGHTAAWDALNTKSLHSPLPVSDESDTSDEVHA
jgi:hypothetical protein